MRNSLVLFILLFSIGIIQGQESSTGDFDYLKEGEKIYHFSEVDTMPAFIGGEMKMYKYIGENLVFPKKARRKNISGRVILSFVVEVDGSISNVKVQFSLEESCDAEAIRVIESFPKWKPGRKDGNIVRVQLMMPIKFTTEGP